MRRLPRETESEACRFYRDGLSSRETAQRLGLSQRSVMRIPAGGAGPITVTPPEKLRKDFQREEAARILEAARGLDPLAKRVLKLMEGLEGAYLPQKQIAERLGRSTGGGSWVTLTTQVKELAGLGFVEIDAKRGVTRALRAKIAGNLATYQATDTDVEAVYQNVLHELATEGEAAA